MGATKTMQEKSGSKASKKLQVYDVLRMRIVRNELKPQQYLSEQELSDDLGISKTPIREALQQLERDRLVVIIPNKGCFVSTISLDFIREVFEIREIYECAAARIAASLNDRSQFEAVFQNHESFQGDDVESARRAVLSGYQIHEIIVNSAKNGLLTEYYRHILDHIVRIRMNFMTNFDSKRVRETREEHRAILQAIIDGNPDEAEKAMREHMRRSLTTIDRLVERARGTE